MSIHLIIHILPQEIDHLEQLIIQLKRNSVYLPKDHNTYVEVVMNANFIDKERSKITIEQLSNKLWYLRDLTSSWATSDFRCDTRNIIKGCNDARREAIKNTVRDYIMYLDADNVFSDYLLSSMYASCQSFSNTENVIITPQTTKLWDDTWNILTNEYFMNEDASHHVYDVRDPYEAVTRLNQQSRNLRLINEFKFAGWGTTISRKLAQFITIPDSLSSYGLDDTFLAHCCYIMKTGGYKVNQYVIENEVIIENNKYRQSWISDLIKSEDKREEYLAQAHANFLPELQKFKSRIITHSGNEFS